MAEALDRSARPPETTELLQVRFDSPADGWLGFELSVDNVKIVETFSHI